MNATLQAIERCIASARSDQFIMFAVLSESATIDGLDQMSRSTRGAEFLPTYSTGSAILTRSQERTGGAHQQSPGRARSHWKLV
jgi:hypothetical protein